MSGRRGRVESSEAENPVIPVGACEDTAVERFSWIAHVDQHPCCTSMMMKELKAGPENS